MTLQEHLLNTAESVLRPPEPDETRPPPPQAPASRPAGFSDLIAPMSPEQFFADYWEKQPLHLKGAGAERFAGLFSSADIDRFLASTRPKPSRIEVVTSQGFVRENYLNHDGTANANLVADRFVNGSTIILAGLDETWEPLGGLVRGIEAELNHPAGVAAYVTPPSVQGVQPHYDTQENFLLQVEGSKHWKVYRPLHVAPPVQGSWSPAPREKVGEPIFEALLEAGDVLYIPRGFIHEGRASDQVSLHLTVDVLVRTWHEFLASALGAMADRDPSYRRSVPPGFLNSDEVLQAMTARFEELLDRFRAGVRLEDAVMKHTEALLVRRPPPPDGHFALLFAEIGADTRLKRRRATLNRVFANDQMAGIQFAGNQLLGPLKILETLQHIGSADSFCAADLPGPLSLQEKLVLVRRLVRTGLLGLA